MSSPKMQDYHNLPKIVYPISEMRVCNFFFVDEEHMIDRLGINFSLM